MPEEYQRMFNDNAGDIQNKIVVKRINELIQKQIDKKNKKDQLSEIPFKIYFRYLIKAIADYQDEIISYNFITPSDMDSFHTTGKQTFLSYEYDDRGLTQALFYYFWIRSGFLYDKPHFYAAIKNQSTHV